jgi:hypothetical protein
MGILHADEIRGTPNLIQKIQVIDRGGEQFAVPTTFVAAAEMIEALRARIERNEDLLREVVKAITPIIAAFQQSETYPQE